MAITIYNLKKWSNMLLGKSLFHVNQDLGKNFSATEIKGYYNNLTEKVTRQPELLNTEKMPMVLEDSGEYILFPVAVFQYGLGALDLYIETQNNVYLKKFNQCCEWAYNSQLENGAWDNFSSFFPDYPYGAMCQGEGASLLLRGYKYLGKQDYLSAAKKAIDFMLLPLEKGGTTQYLKDDVIFMEFVQTPAVLNGWIFAWWGLFDLTLVLTDDAYYHDMLDKSCDSMIKYLPKFSCKIWSIYDLNNAITSPFYHRLHIAQMQAMFALTDRAVFNEYAIKWEKQLHNPIYKSLAFMKKAFQKIKE